MPINFETALYVRQYRDEQGAFRALSIVTKAVAGYLRTLVDPSHGWLRICSSNVATVIRTYAAGQMTPADARVLKRCVTQLLDEGYLLRCRIIDVALEAFVTHDDRDIALSNWIEDPNGDWLVIANWVPAQAGLNPQDTQDWHAMRRERIATAVASPDPTPRMLFQTT